MLDYEVTDIVDDPLEIKIGDIYQYFERLF